MSGSLSYASTHVAIVGGGFAGTSVALALLRQAGVRVTLVERQTARLARGLAYGAAAPDQLLNVRASGMSVFTDDPGHFERWLDRNDQRASPFVRRRLYGLYLREQLAAVEASCPQRLRLLPGEVVDVADEPSTKVVRLRKGEDIRADAVVLACGNAPAAWPEAFARATLPADRVVDDPWAAKLPMIEGGSILLVGSGLTAVDVALAFLESGFAGSVMMLSRRGLMPRSHNLHQSAVRPALPDPLPRRLSELLAEVRRLARFTDWRNAVDALRPVTQDMWADADLLTRRRFLRHLRPWWDVHRHRLAPEVLARVEAARAARQLVVAAGQICSVAARNDGLQINWRERGADAIRTDDFDLVVNCSGVGVALASTADPLLTALIARGAVRPDPLALGLDCDDQLRVLNKEGVPDPRLFCIGPLTRGSFWETTAVPDIRQQAARLADTLAAGTQLEFA